MSAQISSEVNPLENTTWMVQLPEDKEYSTLLEFSNNIYTNTFTYNGESCSVKKSYSVSLTPNKTRGSDAKIGKIKISKGTDVNENQIDQFEIIELTENKLVLKNIKTGAIINCIRDTKK